MDIVTVPEPIEHSVVGVPNEGGNSSVDIVTFRTDRAFGCWSAQ